MSAAAPSPGSAFRLVGSILNDIAHALHSPDHPDERITAVLTWLGRIVPYDRAAILAHEAPDARRLFIAPEPAAADHAMLEPAMSSLLGLLGEQPAPAAGPIPIAVARTMPYGSHLAVPIVGFDVLGVLFVGRLVADGYEEDDILLLSIVASQLGTYLTARHLGAENRRLYEETRGANAAKDDFLITLSHELRTPLNAITGWTRLLRDHPLDTGQARHALEVVDRSARTLTQLLDDLLDVSRIISGKLRLEARLFHLHPVVETALDTVRDVAEKKGVEIRSTLDFGVGPILGDPERVQQIVWNLLSNAIKYTPAGKPIHVELRRDEGWARLRVSDTGEGIAADLLPHVFDRFRQGQARSTRTGGGLGVGLSIVRHLVELHGGRVRAESQGEGQGATLSVWLPLYASGASPLRLDEVSPAEAPAPPDAESRLDGVRILVVEDDPDNREMLVEALELSGAVATPAASAQEALAIARSARPDVIVSDISMPGADGYDLIRSLRALSPEMRKVPAIALTAHARLEDVSRVLEAGFTMHLGKPVGPSSLCAAIARVLRQRGR
jgi:signal transduction histidine kinase/ActR/RegA family two-component response regulator